MAIITHCGIVSRELFGLSTVAQITQFFIVLCLTENKSNLAIPLFRAGICISAESVEPLLHLVDRYRTVIGACQISSIN